jgi:hypothetical protein
MRIVLDTNIQGGVLYPEKRRQRNLAMTVIQLPDDQAAALKARAAAQGLTLEGWFEKLSGVAPPTGEPASASPATAWPSSWRSAM